MLLSHGLVSGLLALAPCKTNCMVLYQSFSLYCQSAVMWIEISEAWIVRSFTLDVRDEVGITRSDNWILQKIGASLVNMVS